MKGNLFEFASESESKPKEDTMQGKKEKILQDKVKVYPCTKVGKRMST